MDLSVPIPVLLVYTAIKDLDLDLAVDGFDTNFHGDLRN